MQLQHGEATAAELEYVSCCFSCQDLREDNREKIWREINSFAKRCFQAFVENKAWHHQLKYTVEIVNLFKKLGANTGLYESVEKPFRRTRLHFDSIFTSGLHLMMCKRRDEELQYHFLGQAFVSGGDGSKDPPAGEMTVDKSLFSSKYQLLCGEAATEKTSGAERSRPCSCDLMQLMRSGCSCGGI